MRTFVVAVCLTLVCCSGSSSHAEDYSYGGVEPASKLQETFQGNRCSVAVRGGIKIPGGSAVKGIYRNPNGELNIFVERFSHLTVRGEARKVTITYVNTNCSVDLSELRIGTGGVEIHSIDHRSGVELGPVSGIVTVKSVEKRFVSHLVVRNKTQRETQLPPQLWTAYQTCPGCTVSEGPCDQH